MAKSDPVEVAVEILDRFTDDLERLEKQLDRIDGKKLSVELEIDDNGSIESTKALLKELEEDLKSDLHIDVKGEKQAAAVKKALAKNENATITYNTRKEGGLGGMGGLGYGDWVSQRRAEADRRRSGKVDVSRAVEGLVSDYLKRVSLDGNPAWADFDITPMGRLVDSSGKEIDLHRPDLDFMQGIKSKTGSWETGTGPSVPAGPMRGRPGLTGIEFDRQQRWSFHKNRARNLLKNSASRIKGGSSRGLGRLISVNLDEKDVIGGLPRKLMRFRPTMVKIMNFVALLVPLMISLAGAILGVAAAFGALAVAGVGVIGLGLFGYGDTMAESMANAQKRVKELKQDLFGVFKPVADTFQPITEGVFNALPHALGVLVNPLKGLASYGDFFEGMMYGGANWVANLVSAMVELREPILTIVNLVAGKLGPYLIDLFSWAVKEVYENFGAFENITRIFAGLVAVIYNVSMAVSLVMTYFMPLLDALVWLSGFLDNNLVVGLLRAVTLFYALRFAAVLAAKGLLFLPGSRFGIAMATIVDSLLLGIKSLYAWITAVNGAKMAWRLFLASTGVGLALVAAGVLAEGAIKMGTPRSAASMAGSGGGYSPSGGRYGSAGSGATINIYGDVGNSEFQRLKDEFPGLYQTEKNIDSETRK